MTPRKRGRPRARPLDLAERDALVAKRRAEEARRQCREQRRARGQCRDCPAALDAPMSPRCAGCRAKAAAGVRAAYTPVAVDHRRREFRHMKRTAA